MFALPLLLAFAVADAPQVLPLWEGKAPHAVGDAPGDKPSITVYRAPANKANGASVVICPGGGYGFLADDHEGKQVAEFFNGIGVAAFVLKYRIVGKDRPGPLHPAPLEDAQRAIRLVRSKAADFGIDPKRVGIMGFSAGGHLASSAATHFDKGGLKNDDDVEKQSCRPDFAILAYPVISMEDGVTHGGSKANLLGKDPDPKLVELLSNEKQVTKETPPCFVWSTQEDKAVPVTNSLRFVAALQQNGIDYDFHVYQKGPHGIGLSEGKNGAAAGDIHPWGKDFLFWMRQNGWLK